MGLIIFSKETLAFVNSFAPWLSAIGTILAVVVSLYLAKSENRIKLKVTASLNSIVSSDFKEPYPKVISLSVINSWHRPVTVTGLYWRCGVICFRKHFYIKPPFEFSSNQLPVRLQDGDEAFYRLSYDSSEKENAIANIINQVLYPHFFINLFTLKLLVHTSVGKTFTTRIDKSLKNLICKEHKKNNYY